MSRSRRDISGSDPEADYDRLKPFIADADKDIEKHKRRLIIETGIIITTFVVGLVVVNKIL